MLTATQLYPEIEELALGHLREALRHYERKSEVVIILIIIISIIRENLENSALVVEQIKSYGLLKTVFRKP